MAGNANPSRGGDNKFRRSLHSRRSNRVGMDSQFNSSRHLNSSNKVGASLRSHSSDSRLGHRRHNRTGGRRPGSHFSNSKVGSSQHLSNSLRRKSGPPPMVTMAGMDRGSRAY